MLFFKRGDRMEHSSRLFTVREQVRNIYKGTRAFVHLRKSKKLKIMNKRLKEEIMLAVTYVNGCEMCSFVHTKVALNSGMNSEEIKGILSGDHSDILETNAVAAIFGEHYADSKEHPDCDSINRLIEEYGEQKAELILAACQMITMTNGMGIALDDLWNRIRFKRNKSSRLVIEVFNPLLTALLFIPLVVFHFVISLFKPLNILKRAMSK